MASTSCSPLYSSSPTRPPPPPPTVFGLTSPVSTIALPSLPRQPPPLLLRLPHLLSLHNNSFSGPTLVPFNLTLLFGPSPSPSLSLPSFSRSALNTTTSPAPFPLSPSLFFVTSTSPPTPSSVPLPDSSMPSLPRHFPATRVFVGYHSTYAPGFLAAPLGRASRSLLP